MTTDNTIPAKNAQIHWSEDDPAAVGRRAVNRVWVFDRTQPWIDNEALECSAGACCVDWLDGSDPRSTPEGVYVGWLDVGFRDVSQHVEALEELAKIEGCGWARKMADAWLRQLQSYGDEE